MPQKPIPPERLVRDHLVQTFAEGLVKATDMLCEVEQELNAHHEAMAKLWKVLFPETPIPEDWSEVDRLILEQAQKLMRDKEGGEATCHDKVETSK